MKVFRLLLDPVGESVNLKDLNIQYQSINIDRMEVIRSAYLAPTAGLVAYPIITVVVYDKEPALAGDYSDSGTAGFFNIPISRSTAIGANTPFIANSTFTGYQKNRSGIVTKNGVIQLRTTFLAGTTGDIELYVWYDDAKLSELELLRLEI